MNTNPLVDEYFEIGCGRCPLVGTPDCKVHSWQDELRVLRKLLLDCGLTEERKWGVPCYTHQNKNILLMSAFKDHCALSFFKGVLLKDEQGILVSPGENSQAMRLAKFTSPDQVLEQMELLRNYIFEAIEVEKAGLKVQMKTISDYEIPDEFQKKLDEDPELKEAFENLTPGRQKGYLLYFSGAKQSKTREDRIEKYIPKIMKGLGFHDR